MNPKDEKRIESNLKTATILIHTGAKIIQEKCEQYWNARNICDEEVHSILEMIHGHSQKIIDRILELNRKANE